MGLRPVIGTTVDIKVMSQPLENKEIDLVLSYWKKWDRKSVPECALNKWPSRLRLSGVLSVDSGRRFRAEDWGGPCSGCWFLVRFSDLILGCQDNGFIQERGVVAGTRVGIVILVPVFLGALVAVFLVVLVFFRALSWLQFRAWTGVGFLRGRLVVFFVAVLVGPFVAVLVVVLLFAFV